MKKCTVIMEIAGSIQKPSILLFSCICYIQSTCTSTISSMSRL